MPHSLPRSSQRASKQHNATQHARLLHHNDDGHPLRPWYKLRLSVMVTFESRPRAMKKDQDKARGVLKRQFMRYTQSAQHACLPHHWHTQSAQHACLQEIGKAWQKRPTSSMRKSRRPANRMGFSPAPESHCCVRHAKSQRHSWFCWKGSSRWGEAQRGTGSYRSSRNRSHETSYHRRKPNRRVTRNPKQSLERQVKDLDAQAQKPPSPLTNTQQPKTRPLAGGCWIKQWAKRSTPVLWAIGTWAPRCWNCDVWILAPRLDSQPSKALATHLYSIYICSIGAICRIK